jgi:hypothetical protein
MLNYFLYLIMTSSYKPFLTFIIFGINNNNILISNLNINEFLTNIKRIYLMLMYYTLNLNKIIEFNVYNE